MREEWQEEGNGSEQCGVKERGRGADTERNKIKRGTKRQKERKYTVNIHRRPQGGRSHNVLLKNPGKLSHLSFIRFFYENVQMASVQWFSASKT